MSKYEETIKQRVGGAISLAQEAMKRASTAPSLEERDQFLGLAEQYLLLAQEIQETVSQASKKETAPSETLASK